MAVTQKQLDNLIPAQKGEVRNPNGRPKGAKSFKTIIESLFAIGLKVDTEKDFYKQIAKVMPEILENGQTITTQDLITIRAIADAVAGSDPDRARDWLSDRYEGKPKQTVSIDLDPTDPDVIVTALKLAQALVDEAEGAEG